MTRNRVLQGILVVVAIGMLAMVSQARSRSKPKPTYDGGVNFGEQLLELQGGCLSVDGTVTSGSFFENVKRNDNGDAPEYTRNGKVVREYPQSLTASIRILGNQCGDVASGADPIFKGDSYSLTFGVEWKKGLELRPAALSATVAHCVGASVLTNANGDMSTVPSLTCQLTVNSKGVPLGDHLIVSIFSENGKRLTRISAAP
jgi:hypothetical protein